MEKKASKITISRLQRELLSIQKEKCQEIVIQPAGGDLFEWHCSFAGPVGSEFEQGIYHFAIKLPVEYPMKPPVLISLNNNGRWGHQKKICLSFSDFHPESWNPAWTVKTMCMAIRSYMSDGGSESGAIRTTKHEKIEFAKESRSYCCTGCGIDHKTLHHLCPK
eukprot:gnl/Carplike_NY0171/27092_a52432_63.p1 GENE.gnl/Carplike_NY0171/27092_a52432_63~~gnl/Carplike_NY0171/27092_a52432_63.p1  ORF type:complete len:164 (-),score=7.14 gnl/Carplike_NY0171/27092_a52432_63:11-502(-)